MQALEKDAALRAKTSTTPRANCSPPRKTTALRVQDLDDAGKKLTALQDRRTKLETDLAGRDKELTLLRPYKEKWAADEEQLASVKKDLLASQGDLARRRQDVGRRGRRADGPPGVEDEAGKRILQTAIKS